MNTETSKQIRVKVGALFFFFFKYTLSTKLSLILILFQILKSKIEAHIIMCQIKYFCIFLLINTIKKYIKISI